MENNSKDTHEGVSTPESENLLPNDWPKEGRMLKSERDVLLEVCRQRERVAKSEVNAVAARRKADFERGH